MNDMNIKIVQVVDFKELTTVMPLILEGFDKMNKRYKAFDLTKEQYVREMIWIVGSPEENGIAVVWDGETPVGYGVARNSTEKYSDIRTCLLFALYVKAAYSKDVSKDLLEFLEDWVRYKGYHRVVAYNGRFSGACFRFFEKVAGMRRQSVRFCKDL